MPAEPLDIMNLPTLGISSAGFPGLQNVGFDLERSLRAVGILDDIVGST